MGNRLCALLHRAGSTLIAALALLEAEVWRKCEVLDSEGLSRSEITGYAGYHQRGKTSNQRESMTCETAGTTHVKDGRCAARRSAVADC